MGFSLPICLGGQLSSTFDGGRVVVRQSMPKITLPYEAPSKTSSTAGTQGHATPTCPHTRITQFIDLSVSFGVYLLHVMDVQPRRSRRCQESACTPDMRRKPRPPRTCGLAVCVPVRNLNRNSRQSRAVPCMMRHEPALQNSQMMSRSRRNTGLVSCEPVCWVETYALPWDNGKRSWDRAMQSGYCTP